MSERKFHRRLFLNDNEGAAIVEAIFDDNSWIERDTSKRRQSFDGTLHITDCSRSIELSVNFTDPEEARDCLRKLDRLVDVVQEMREAVAKAAKREWPGRKF